MDPQEIIDIIRAFFNAILTIFNSLKGLFNKEDATEEPTAPEKPV